MFFLQTQEFPNSEFTKLFEIYCTLDKMSCHGCTSTFGFLKREYGCPKCGFSYCKKCLRFKTLDVKTNKEILVCHRCNEVATSNMDPEEPPIITKALQRLESMENPARPPITVYKQHAREARLAQLKKGLSQEDQQLADRLESLRKHEDGNVGLRRRSEDIQEEIEARLARLKDEDPSLQSCSKASGHNFNVKPETDMDLIAKYSAEVQLDNQYHAGLTDAVTGIEGRLAKLRGDDVSREKSSGTTQSAKEIGEVEELSEDEQIAQIIQRLKNEVDLEAKQPECMPEFGSDTSTVPQDVSMYSDSDEDLDNLCRICDEKRATLKCDECDGDLFCKKCFAELHAELGESHKPTAFKK